MLPTRPLPWAAADTLVELLDTFGVELPEPKVELPLGLLGVAAGLVAYTGDDVDEAAAKILEARAEARCRQELGSGRRHPRPAQGPGPDD